VSNSFGDYACGMTHKTGLPLCIHLFTLF
jgi:hypothetical protein